MVMQENALIQAVRESCVAKLQTVFFAPSDLITFYYPYFSMN